MFQRQLRHIYVANCLFFFREVINIQGVTHLSAGFFLGAVSGLSFGGSIEDVLASTLLGGVMAVLPDVDHPGSMAGKIFRPLSLFLEERWGHRDSPTHSAAFVLLASLPVAVAWFLPGHPMGLPAAAVLGGTSHLVMDSVTRSGVRPWRYLPVAGKWRHKVYRGKLESGKSPLEWGIACVGFLGTTVLTVFTVTRLI